MISELSLDQTDLTCDLVEHAKLVLNLIWMIFPTISILEHHVFSFKNLILSSVGMRPWQKKKNQ